MLLFLYASSLLVASHGGLSESERRTQVVFLLLNPYQSGWLRRFGDMFAIPLAVLKGFWGFRLMFVGLGIAIELGWARIRESLIPKKWLWGWPFDGHFYSLQSHKMVFEGREKNPV